MPRMPKTKKKGGGAKAASPTTSPSQSPPPSPERAQSERLAQARLARIRQSPRTVARSISPGGEIAATLGGVEAELQALLRTSQELRLDGEEALRQTGERLPENMPQPPTPSHKPASPEEIVELAPASQRASPPALPAGSPARLPPVLPSTGSPVLPNTSLTIRLDADGAPLPLPKQAWPSSAETQTSPPPGDLAAETQQVVAATQLAERIESDAKAVEAQHEAQVAELTEYHREHVDTSEAILRAIQEDHDAKISVEVSMRESLQQQLELAVENLRASEAAAAASEESRSRLRGVAVERETVAAQATAELQAVSSRLAVVEADLELTSVELSSAQATAESETENAKTALAQALQLTRSVSRSEEAEAAMNRNLDERLRGARAEAARAVAAADAARNDTAEQLTATRDELVQFKSESEAAAAASKTAAEEELEKAYAASQEALHEAQADADSQLSVEVSMREALQGQLALAQRDADLNRDLNEELNDELEQVRAQHSQAERELESVSRAARTVQEAAAQASFARSESQQALTRAESDKEDADRRLSIETSKVAELILEAERYKTERDEARGNAHIQHCTYSTERDALAAERDTLTAERDTLRQDMQARAVKGTDLASELNQANAEKAQLTAQLQQSRYNSGAATKQAATELGTARARLSSMEMELSTAEAAVVAEKEATTEANARFAELSSRISERIQSSEHAEQTLGMQAENAESRLNQERDRAATLARELEMARGEAVHAVAECRATTQQSAATAQQSSAEVTAVMARLQVSESMEQQLEVQIEQMHSEMQLQQQQLEQSAERWRQRQLLDDAEQRVSQSVVTTGTPRRSSPNKSSPKRSPEPPTPSLLVEMRQVDARYAPDAPPSPNDSAVVYQGSPHNGDPPTPSLLADLCMLDARYDTGPSPTVQLSAPSAADWTQSANSSGGGSARSQIGQLIDQASPQEEPAPVARGEPRGVKGEVRFVTLRERPELAGEVASWLFAEWGHLSDDPDNSCEKLRNRMVDQIKRTSAHDLPVVVVALEVLPPGDGSISAPSPRSPSVTSLGSGDRSGKEMAVPIGTASLKLQELKEHFPNTQHWLGSVVVRPSSRGCGVGAALIVEVERRAAERGLTELHLATEELDGGLYTRCGWEAAPIVSNPIVDRGDQVLIMKKRLMAVGLSRLSMAGVRHTPTRLRSRLGLDTPERQPVLLEPEPEPQPEPVALQVDESATELEFADADEEDSSPLLNSNNPQRLWRKTRMAMSMVVGLPIAIGIACQTCEDDSAVVAKAVPITPHRQHSVGVVQEREISARTTNNGQQTSQPDDPDAGLAVPAPQKQAQAAAVTRDSETQMTPKRRRPDPGSPPHAAGLALREQLADYGAVQSAIARPPPPEAFVVPPQQNPTECAHCNRPWNRIWRGGHRTAMGIFCSAVCAAKEEALRLHGAPDYANSRSRTGHPTAAIAARGVEAANSFWYRPDPGDPVGISQSQREYVPTNRAWESAERANALLEKARPRERPERERAYTQEEAARDMGIIMASAKAAAAAVVEQLREQPAPGHGNGQPPQQQQQQQQQRQQPEPVNFDRFLAEDAAAAAAAPLSELYPTTDLYPYEVQAREEMRRAQLAQQQRRGGMTGYTRGNGSGSRSALERVTEAERARRYGELSARLGNVQDPRQMHAELMAVPSARPWSERA